MFEGKGNSLLLLLDYNKERSFQISPSKGVPPAISSKSLIRFDNEKKCEETKSAKVHLDTLSAYDGFGEGAYSITNVKRMKSKADFLKMPLKDRNCEVESYSDCRTRKLLQECNCAPWDLPEFQVKIQQEKLMKFIAGPGLAKV